MMRSDLLENFTLPPGRTWIQAYFPCLLRSICTCCATRCEAVQNRTIRDMYFPPRSQTLPSPAKYAVKNRLPWRLGSDSSSRLKTLVVAPFPQWRLDQND